MTTWYVALLSFYAKVHGHKVVTKFLDRVILQLFTLTVDALDTLEVLYQAHSIQITLLVALLLRFEL